LRHSLARSSKRRVLGFVEASNGKEVVQDLKTSADFCLLLTDIVMPEMEGLELIKHLRRYHPKLPIVAMSGTFEGGFLMLRECSALKKPCKNLLNERRSWRLGICLNLTIISGP
jgi:CheY-like chemotaxis protein